MNWKDVLSMVSELAVKPSSLESIFENIGINFCQYDFMPSINDTTLLTEATHYEAIEDRLNNFDNSISMPVFQSRYIISSNILTKQDMEKTINEFNDKISLVCHMDYFLNQIDSKHATLLTLKEKEVLNWIADGKSSWEISKILSTSERTINFHVANIKNKLTVSNRCQIISEAFRLKILK